MTELTETVAALLDRADRWANPTGCDLDRVRQEAKLSVDALWLRYVALGGLRSRDDVEAWLHRALRPSRYEHDLLAQALNERLRELGLNPLVPYANARPGGRPGSDRSREGTELRPPAPTVSVVIPTLNESKNLPYVLNRLPDEVSEVIVVDGHSTDGTVDVAKLCRPDVRIVLQDGRGKGNALACGFRAVTSDITVMLDADGSTDPAEIPRFVAELVRGADFVKGSRYIAGGGSADLTRLRRLGNRVLVGLVNSFCRARYTDLCYGYNAFWTRYRPFVDVDCNGFEVETLMNIRVARAGLAVAEVPSFEAPRRYGASNLNAAADGIRVLRTIVAEWVRPR